MIQPLDAESDGRGSLYRVEPLQVEHGRRSGYSSLQGVENGDFFQLEDEDDRPEGGRVAQRTRVQEDEDEDEWMGPSNLDDFFTQVYNYYYEKGFSCIVAKAIVNILTLGFTVIFSSFLLGFLNWNELMKCTDEDTCKPFADYIMSLNGHTSLSYRVFVVLYSLLFTTYWIWSMKTTTQHVKKSWEMRTFFSKKLRISTRELQTMEWYQVVDKLVKVQESGECVIQINGSGFDAKDVVMRIMRKKNFMIALINEEVLPVGTRVFGQHWFLGRTLELMIEWTILDVMFDSQCQVKREFLRNPEALRSRMVLFGVGSLLLMPFSLGFMIIYSFLKYAEEWHSKRNYLGPRWWTPYALWQFREFNEVDHVFEKRTVNSLKHADEYLRQFPSPVPTVVAGGVSFVTGGFVGVLMLFTLLDESILLHIKLDDRNLVWYIAIFSGVLAISRSLIPPLEQTVFSPEKVMRKVVAFTHYLPSRWRNNTHSFDVRDEFSDYIPYKVMLLLRELMCIVTTPYVLMVVFPRHVVTIVEFIKSRTETIEGLGDVCVYSKMDLSENGDVNYGSRVKSSLGGNFVNVKRNVLHGGKLEKSWLSFKLNYPNWVDHQPVPDGVDCALDVRLGQFQRDVVEQSVTSSVNSGDRPFDSLQGSFTAAADLDRRHHSRQAKAVGTPVSSHADHEFFSVADAKAQPLDTFKYPDSENYFYWLEEFRDRADKADTPPL